jgi:single-stranded-DNA-specific exonuclease
LDLAHELDELNRERRQIESVMKEEALQSLETLAANLEAAKLTNNVEQTAYSISLFHPDWHQGVVGIVASRVKELHHRPCLIFAPVADSQEIRGSGRSIEGFHLRDALDLLSKRHPALILKFGGHAMAAGLSLRAQDFEFFQREFEAVAASLLTVDSLTRSMHIDGSLSAQHLNLKTATLLNETVWGQGFLPPLFQDAFEVVNQKRVGTNHLKATLRKEGVEFGAMCFNRTDFFPLSIKAVYQMVANEWRGGVELQLYLEQVEAT